MSLSFFKNTFLLWVLVCFSCGSQTNEKEKSNSEDIVIHDKVNVNDFKAKSQKSEELKENDTVKKYGRLIEDLSNSHIWTGANQWKTIDLLKGKKVGVVANQTSIVNDTLGYPNEVRVVDVHLVDFLVEVEVWVDKVFGPEHGFRGTAYAGEEVKDDMGEWIRIPIISLYGKNKKPSPQQLEGLEVMVFDIQDVGARFYTYISTLHYVMEACAEAGIPLVVLDRPNPNGHYIDGPILEPQHKSFVGMHPVPVVHGMTIGEYAKMINGEGWLANKIKCDLTVVKMENYTHNTEYSLPIKPSPNLPNDVAINLYPSLCFFEGTIVSAGRGTENQFQIFGAPSLPKDLFPYIFTPQSNEGAKYPKFKGKLCYGLDLRNTEKLYQLNLKWLIDAYKFSENKEEFFNAFFTKLAGTTLLQEQIELGLSEQEIRQSWKSGLSEYDMVRSKYLLYD